MSEIKTFKFDKKNFGDIKEYHFGNNWPSVYIIENGKEIYIGETTDAYKRSRQHYTNPERQKLKNIHIVSDEEYNKSAALDIESSLIQHIVADEKFIVQNANGGLNDHNYYDKQKYQAKFEKLWEQLKELGLVAKDLVQIRNSQLFKYSPYKSLTDDQLSVVKKISKKIQNTDSQTFIVDGSPGTGKTILATYMMKNFTERDEFKDMKIGLVVPMTSLRQSIKTVFKHIKGLNASMVLGPSDVVGKEYDILIVDETHRLKQRKNVTNYPSYDENNKKLGLDNSGTQLDWILKSSKYQVLFYDKNQSVRPEDIEHEDIEKLDAIKYTLKKQVRVKGGDKYINFVNNLFDLELTENNFEDYDFKVYDNVSDMISDIKDKNKEHELCRVVAGYAWPWRTKNGGEYDIEIDGLKLVWNSVTSNWVNSENSINEIGCIHTVQGYDLNYTGVIIGPELSYDKENHKLVVDRDKYMDINGKRSLNDPEELEGYIINIYKTLMTRGIHGTYVYAVDEGLREFLRDNI